MAVAQPRTLTAAPTNTMGLGVQASRPLGVCGKPQYFVRGKSQAVGRAAWPTPSSANIRRIYFLANNFIPLLCSFPLVTSPQLVCLVRSSPFLLHLAKPWGASGWGCALDPWRQGLGHTGSPVPGPSLSILSSQLVALLHPEPFKGHQPKQGSQLHSIRCFPLCLPPNSAALSSRTER